MSFRAAAVRASERRTVEESALALEKRRSCLPAQSCQSPDSIPPCSTITASEEAIASNILADRLQHLVEVGVLTRAADPTHKQKQIYSLTEMGIQLLPVFIALGAWGRRFLPATEALSIRAELLEEGGNRLLRRFMAELRAEHLRGETISTVRDELRAAYEKARTKEQRGATRRGSRSSKAERRS